MTEKMFITALRHRTLEVNESKLKLEFKINDKMQFLLFRMTTTKSINESIRHI